MGTYMISEEQLSRKTPPMYIRTHHVPEGSRKERLILYHDGEVWAVKEGGPRTVAIRASTPTALPSEADTWQCSGTGDASGDGNVDLKMTCIEVRERTRSSLAKFHRPVGRQSSERLWCRPPPAARCAQPASRSSLYLLPPADSP